jgi:hypothetical protein
MFFVICRLYGEIKQRVSFLLFLFVHSNLKIVKHYEKEYKY